MGTLFYLKSCSTCKRIMAQFDLRKWELREIGSQSITEEELSEMYAITNSYEDLFSKRSTQIKAENIDVRSLKEEDYKRLILQHYSFLKRPVFLTKEKIFVGNAKHTLDDLEIYFNDFE